ncbi:hypothetical protein F5Y10DRAFT_259233 [Nemania abortiva]|nr:hypothetical protein F5Y10DRAFT_259233 [Nemania abortiva]
MPLVLKSSLLSIRLVADATTRGPQLELSSCWGQSFHKELQKDTCGQYGGRTHDLRIISTTL